MSEPISNDSSGVEGHAGEQKCDDPTAPQPEQPHVSTERAEMPSNAPSSVTEPSENQASPAVTSSTCWSCKKPITEKLDLDLAELPNRGEPMCGACRGQHCD